ncbi:G- protein-coupled receptor [Steccherinum ochraceum]|uniref:G-protein-coupled receptor n=1 Tax=Steccherinum ochraceum TaxID=92696 RepID=A0A4R0RCB7_9APHY|nr:G- protein-coupled receptor [Steccherinum ochraceum]
MYGSFSTIVLSALAALPFVLGASVTNRSLEVRANTCSTANPTYTDYKYLGCAHDSAKRALTGYYGHAVGDEYMSKDLCTSICARSGPGFPLAGIETGRECYCGSSFQNGEGYSIPESSCNQQVGIGGAYDPAGGSWALSIYVPQRQSVNIVNINDFSEIEPGCTLPAGWQYDQFLLETVPTDCFHDGPNRALTGYSFKSDKMTSDLCTSTCASKGFKIAGIEVGSECYCGNQFENGEGYAIDSSICNQSPSASPGGFGGGKWGLAIYRATTISKAIDLHISLPAAPKKRSLVEKHFGRNANTTSSL